MRSLGLDVGDRRIGVAMSDPSGIVASPLTIIERQNDTIDIEAIVDIAKRNEVGHIIVGLPLAADGGVGMQAEKVYDFVNKLKASIDIPLQFRDESFSTDSARKLMLQTKSKKLAEIPERCYRSGTFCNIFWKNNILSIYRSRKQ